jgi:hypothetical protein
MSLSMSQITVPVFVRAMENLSAILAKGAASAEARKIAPAILINDRIAPDMLPLARQIHIASDAVKNCVARLAGVEPPVFPDTETTFPELQERIAKTIAFVQSVPAEKIDGSEDRVITIKFPGVEMQFAGLDYVLNMVYPNLYFHSTTTYAILRHNGVDLGKMDYLGAVPTLPKA